ncbi:MAG: energy-coupling factor transporter ATPase [Candidatus Zixiibacteriota bacterium]
MLEFNQVSYHYRLDEKSSVIALDHINLRLKEGEFVSIIGSNGSGKSTLAKLLPALILPESGNVWVDGLDTKDKNSQKTIRQKVGMVFQNPDTQIISTSVEREIAFGLENLALPYREMKERVKWALDYFHLGRYRTHPPHKLSGGEKQRVALAAVLCMHPQYLILDEPTSLLDPQGRLEILSLVQKLIREGNVTVIHITQFPEEAMSADRILVMDKGKIVLDDSPVQIFKQKEFLEKIGLEVPFTLKIASTLKQRGWFLSDEYLNIDELVNKITQKVITGEKGLVDFSAVDGQRAHPERSRRITDDKNLSPIPSPTSSAKTAPQIAVKDVEYLYDQGLPTKEKALDGITIEIHHGDFIGLIGPTGSGKSTLVQHLNGLLVPVSGKVEINGENLKNKNVDLKKVRQKVGLVFQFPELQLFEDTVYDDIAFGPKNLSLPAEEIDARVQQAMRLMELNFEQFASRSPFSLSGGEQRKVAIAGILAMNPEVLILDEPTCGLDPKSTEEMKKLLQELNSKGVTIILISHNMDLIAELAHKIILLKEGKVAAFCEKKEFFKDVERIKTAGLNLPQVVELVWKLREKGIKIEKDVFSEEELLSLFELR